MSKFQIFENRFYKRIICIISIIAILLSTVAFSVSAAGNDYEAFLDKMGYTESRNNYTVVNSYGYMGRWQLGPEALKDIGFMTSSGEWSALANSFGVYSVQDFLNTPEAQDYAIRLYDKKLWSYIEYLGDDEYIGSEIEGIVVTQSGLLAAAHLVGASGVHQMFITGHVTVDADGNKCTYYLKNFAGYDLSAFLGTDLTKYVTSKVNKKTAKKVKEALASVQKSSKLCLYGNTSECNYLLGTDFSTELDDKYIFPRDKSVYSVSIDTKEKFGDYESLKIVGKKAGGDKKDINLATDTNGNHNNDGYYGDTKKLTLSFYAKSSVDGAKLFWRFGYGKNHDPIILTKDWKKYTVTVTKSNSEGSKIYIYFDKAGTFYLNQLMMVDGEKAATINCPEGSKCIKTVQSLVGADYGPLPKPVRNGYTFDGWFTSKVGGKRITSSTPVYDSSLNVYAHWTKISSYIPENSSEFNGHYYTLFTDDLSWEEAKKICERMGGHLVTIESREENDAVTALASTGSKGLYWIGASSDGKGNWKWVDGSKFSYTSWADKQPSGGKEKYAHIYGRIYNDNSQLGKWNDIIGNKNEISFFAIKNIGYICEFEPEKIKATEQKTYENSTYKIFDCQISWYNARFYCEALGGSLATITDKKENKFITDMVKKGKSGAYWLGGTNRVAGDKYVWITGEEFKFNKWAPKNPTSKSATDGIEHFVQFVKSSLKWNDNRNISSDSIKTGFIMETDNSLAKIESISISNEPLKRTYYVGESLNTVGMAVTAHMSDGKAKKLEYGFSCSPLKFNQSGLQTVRVEYDGLEAEYKVYVFASKDSVKVKSISFDKDKLKVTVGKTVSQMPIFNPADAECKVITWSSGNEKVAKVDDNGTVTGISKGTTEISAKTLDGSFVCKYTIKVKRTFGQWMRYYVLFGWTKE